MRFRTRSFSRRRLPAISSSLRELCLRRKLGRLVPGGAAAPTVLPTTIAASSVPAVPGVPADAC